MSTARYEVTVRGEYYADLGDRKGKTRRKLPEAATKFKLPTLDGALSKLRRVLLPAKLQEITSDFRRVRLCEIVDVKELTKPTPKQAKEEEEESRKPVQRMSKKDLTEFITLNQLPVDPNKFSKVTDLRDAVEDAYEEKIEAEKKRHEKEAKDEADKAEDKALLEENDINPDSDILG